MLQAALGTGATDVIVTGTSRDGLRLDAARALGAHVIDVDAQDVIAAVHERTAGRGADIVFDVSPATATVSLSLALVRAGGTVLLAGLKEGRPSRSSATRSSTGPFASSAALHSPPTHSSWP